MLPRNYRFTVQNITGQTIAASGIVVHMRRWKRASDGSITFEATEATVLDNPTTLMTATFPDVLTPLPGGGGAVPLLATGGYQDGTAQDNSTDKWEGGTIDFRATAPVSSNGSVILFFKRSTDGGTTFDDDAIAIELDRLSFTAAGTKRLTLQI